MLRIVHVLSRKPISATLKNYTNSTLHYWHFAMYIALLALCHLQCSHEHYLIRRLMRIHLRYEPGHSLWTQSCCCSHLHSARSTCTTLCEFFSLSLGFLVYNGMPILSCGFPFTSHCKPSEDERCITAFSFLLLPLLLLLLQSCELDHMSNTILTSRIRSPSSERFSFLPK